MDIVPPNDRIDATIEADYGNPHCVDVYRSIRSIPNSDEERNEAKSESQEVRNRGEGICGIHDWQDPRNPQTLFSPVDL